MSDEGDFSSQQEIEDHERIFKARAKARAEELSKQPVTILGVTYCDDCNDEIPPKRAKIPGVVRCIDCQELYERDSRYE